MTSHYVAAENRGTKTYSLSDAYSAALKGTRLAGFTGEVSQELAQRHGSEGTRIPLEAIMQAKATGASGLVPGAVPLAGFDMESSVTEVGNAIRTELLASKFGVSTRATSQAEFRIPTVSSRPSATILDIDEAIPDQGGSSFDFVSVRPVIAGSLIEVANSLDFASPDAVAIVTSQISAAVTEAIDNAFVSGYGPTGQGRSFGGLVNVATASGRTFTNNSTIAEWASLKELYEAYTKTSSSPDARWLMHPRVADQVLATAPMFAGSQTAIASGLGVNFLLGAPVVQGRLPVTVAGSSTTEVFFGDPREIFLVLFDSASISLVANPYEAAAFSRGSTLLRVMVSFGMAIRDPRRLVSATVQLP